MRSTQLLADFRVRQLIQTRDGIHILLPVLVEVTSAFQLYVRAATQQIME
jgi:hypothetical protein